MDNMYDRKIPTVSQLKEMNKPCSPATSLKINLNNNIQSNISAENNFTFKSKDGMEWPTSEAAISHNKELSDAMHQLVKLKNNDSVFKSKDGMEWPTSEAAISHDKELFDAMHPEVKLKNNDSVFKSKDGMEWPTSEAAISHNKELFDAMHQIEESKGKHR